MSRPDMNRPSDLPGGSPHSGKRRQANSQPTRRPLPLFKVILLRSNDCDLMFVVRTVMELTHFCRAEATHKMWEAHHCGRSVILVTYQERAELYADQFQSRGLPALVEPA